jgi:aminoglycoside/choline kinase family phosphotransferase
MTPLLTRPKPPTIAQVLQQGLSDCWHQPVQIINLRAEALYSYSTHPIYRLQATLSEGRSLPVIFKRLRRDIRQGREILLYQGLLTHRRFGAPELYASLCDPAQGRYWLFMEDVGELKLEYCDVEEWLIAFRWLAQMHATYYGQVSQLRALGCLGEHHAAFYRDLAQAARTQMQQKAEPHAVDRYDRLLTRLDDLIAFLVQQPQTLVHGDLSCHNLIVQADRSIRPIDWEWAAIGVPAWDVVRLLSGWKTGKPRFLTAYWEEWIQHSPIVDRPTFDRTLAACEILKILWYLRWWIKPCQDAAFVDQMFDRMERFWHQLD